LGLPGQNAGVFVMPGTVGVVRNQLARLQIVDHVNARVPPTQCNIVASVFDIGGQLLAEAAGRRPRPASIDFFSPRDKKSIDNSELVIWGTLGALRRVYFSEYQTASAR
jgi:hypothetical protein